MNIAQLSNVLNLPMRKYRKQGRWMVEVDADASPEAMRAVETSFPLAGRGVLISDATNAFIELHVKHGSIVRNTDGVISLA